MEGILSLFSGWEALYLYYSEGPGTNIRKYRVLYEGPFLFRVYFNYLMGFNTTINISFHNRIYLRVPESKVYFLHQEQRWELSEQLRLELSKQLRFELSKQLRCDLKCLLIRHEFRQHLSHHLSEFWTQVPESRPCDAIILARGIYQGKTSGPFISFFPTQVDPRTGAKYADDCNYQCDASLFLMKNITKII